MQQNVSYSKIEHISFEICDSLQEFIDLSIEDDESFFVSEKGEHWTLTHNSGAPDIDTDLADRDKVLEQLRNYFGYNNVLPISNYNTFKLKSLVKDIAKFYGVPFEEVNEATRTVEQDVRKATTKHGDDKNLFILKYDEAIEHSKSFKAFIDKYPHVAESIKILFKQNRSLSRHAGGVVIADDLPDIMPVITSGGEPQTCWVEGVEIKTLEKVGSYIKYDLLGLGTLRLFERSIELILKKSGNKNPSFVDVKQWYDNNMSPDVIDFDDQDVYEYVYHDGRWCGIFQCVDECENVYMGDGTEKPLKDVIVGDVVVCFDELKHEFTNSIVTSTYDKGDKNCIEIMFENGKTLKCTSDHQILTSNRGWVEASMLESDDDVECFI